MSNNRLMLDSDEGIKLGSTDGKLFLFTLLIDDRCTLWTGEVNYMGYCDG